MRKILNVSCAMLFAALILGPVLSVSAQGPTSEPYKAIAKIRTFALDTEDNLTDIGFGSGIIISESGLLLTNHHVLEVLSSFDNSPLDGIYLICLPENTVEEPDCSYTAKFIATNEDLDVSLLQIEAIPGLSSQTVFPYLELNQVDNTATNDPITAIGYPDVGGSTVTSSQGVISGKVEKYGKQWIKTDAMISFGSSGGAALNAAKKVIGITSAGHSDLLGSLGYITNIASLNAWITTNISKSAIGLTLTARLHTFANSEKNLNNSNIFENQNPHFSVTKPADWEFARSGENHIYITNPSDEDGGEIQLDLIREPYITDVNSIIPLFRRAATKTLNDSLFKVQENTTLPIGNASGKKIRFTDKAGQNIFYAVPVRNYIMIISYSYGLDDKDRSIIEGIIKSLNIPKDIRFTESKQYTHLDPYFSIKVDKDWVIERKNDKADPLIILNKKYRDFYITVDVRRTDEVTRPMNQDALAKYLREGIDRFNQEGESMDIKMDMTEVNAHHKTGGAFTDVIKELTTVRSRSTNKIVGYEYGFTKKLNDKIILNISMYYNGSDLKALATYKSEFARLMKNFSISKATPKKDTDKDGLNDDDEKKYKTNPNKKDTDGDGFSDWEEIKNGYNPLGKGRLKK